MRILLIEDNDLLRRVARALLVKYAHEVEAAPSGAEGLRLAHSQEFDMVVCDLEIGDMTGLEVRDQLPRGLGRRFLLWTGRPDLAEGQGVRVLRKTARVQEFLDAVDEAYKGGS